MLQSQTIYWKIKISLFDLIFDSWKVTLYVMFEFVIIILLCYSSVVSLFPIWIDKWLKSDPSLKIQLVFYSFYSVVKNINTVKWLIY